MPKPFEIQPVPPNFAIWHYYDQSVKTELFSTALSTNSGICLIDPTPLPILELTRLFGGASARAIVVTNQNHWRAAAQLAKTLEINLFAACQNELEEEDPRFIQLRENERICETLRVIPIEGAVPGEIVLYSDADGGALIFGDALINFEPYGFTFLPPKYCTNAKQMRRSLQKLLDLKVARMFFAHGFPIVSQASERLHQLLGAES